MASTAFAPRVKASRCSSPWAKRAAFVSASGPACVRCAVNSLPDGVGHRRVIVREVRQPGLQRPLTCGADFATDRVAVVQIERAQQGLQRQALNHQRAQHDRERGQHDQVTEGKAGRERHRRRERDDAAHARPRNDQAAPHGRPQHRTWRMKADASMAPADHGIEGHVPGQPHDDHGHQDGAGDDEVAAALGGLQAPENGAESADR